MSSTSDISGRRPKGYAPFACIALVAQGQLFGSLNLSADHPGGFAPEHLELARQIAEPVAVAIRHARLFQEVQHGRERLQALSGRLMDVQEAERRHLARDSTTRSASN
jgi:GAF domain-containing protein